MTMVNLELAEILDRFICGATITNEEHYALHYQELINDEDELTTKGDELLSEYNKKE